MFFWCIRYRGFDFAIFGVFCVIPGGLGGLGANSQLIS